MYILRASQYSKSDSVKYALKYALNPNKKYRYFPLIENNSGDCSNFVSQCLYAGGAPMIFNSKNPWWYNNINQSLSWTLAHSLYWYLKINTELNLPGCKGVETTDINSLKLGDLIFYENSKKIIFHSAIITGFSQNKPLISQHSREALNISYLKTWKSPKYHFLKIHL
ncbi:amidase domain-containing protein [Clostridium drakei]|uniref:Methylase n=1 Tax=Clostridium drakei TaxID=332101 RepID=A0A2U8DVW8_9CLOT|nr:amidase domain-containing protein [Clostridium drakei]AWI06515.1 methylase [Clostridium drakei]